MPTDGIAAGGSINERIDHRTSIIGGLPISVVDRQMAAQWIVTLARTRERQRPPYFHTSANGEVIARAWLDARFRSQVAGADEIVADGQAMVFASRLLCRAPLPERVATTDLFHDVARLAERDGVSFYMLGASEVEVARAVANVRRLYPQLRILGFSHGYLEGAALVDKLAEINALAPDILWLGLGVPREQDFVACHGEELSRVGLIKTAGGLFNYLSGSAKRAPQWMQRLGLEWLWRTCLEPRRLLLRYLITNPIALYLLLFNSR